MIENRKNSWYEDDVVKYTASGRIPKIPDRYKTCNIRIYGYRRDTFKCFRTRTIANIALNHAVGFNPQIVKLFGVFLCNKCQMYHIISNKNYKKYLANGSNGKNTMRRPYRSTKAI